MSQIKYLIQACLILFCFFLFFELFQMFSDKTSTEANTSFLQVQIDESSKEQSNPVNGQRQFQVNCQTCHAIDKELVGPALAGFETHGPWRDRKNVYAWIHNPVKFMNKDRYTRQLVKKMGL